MIITVSGFPCRVSRANTSRSSFSLCALAAGNRCTGLFITGAQIRFPFARSRDDCRSNSDLPRRRGGNRAVFWARVVGRQEGETSPLISKHRPKDSEKKIAFSPFCLVAERVRYRVRKIFREFRSRRYAKE